MQTLLSPAQLLGRDKRGFELWSHHAARNLKLLSHRTGDWRRGTRGFRSPRKWLHCCNDQGNAVYLPLVPSGRSYSLSCILFIFPELVPTGFSRAGGGFQVLHVLLRNNLSREAR